MIKTTATVHGMMCHMCEKNITEAVEKNFNVESVTALREQEQVIIISQNIIEEQKLFDIITGQGFLFEKAESEAIAE